MLIQIFIHVLLFQHCLAHISWLFPEARWPHFDYTNTRDNVPPCGLAASKNASEFQTFVTNKAYQLNWRMQYGHQGGLQINLLNADGKLMKRLVPGENSTIALFDTEMSQQQETEVHFDQPCEHCILQIMKQALELGKEFRYFSCADVQIVPESISKSLKEMAEKGPINGMQQCHAKSKWNNSKCECDRKHTGEYCAIKIDCKTDSDCGVGGVCQEYANDDVRKVCYCAYGRYGNNCEMVSKQLPDECFNKNAPDPSHLDTFDAYALFKRNCYKQKQLNENDSVFWRVVNNEEVEIILDFKGFSYVGIGWRPVNITKKCRDFPSVEMELAGFNKQAYDADLHPMHCTDMIWASVINQTKLHIRDGYSRDKGTPLIDEHLPGGENSLVAAFGLETMERTIVMFRRPIVTSDPADHPLGPGQLFGIYAKGQDDGEKRWVVKEALELPRNEKKTFVHRDEFMYHGGDYRAMAMFKFVE